MLQTKADVSKDILENITLGRFIRENRVEKNQDGMKWRAFKVGKFFMKHLVLVYSKNMMIENILSFLTHLKMTKD